jgi:thiol-disulfide isomerase/thioredoxin
MYNKLILFLFTLIAFTGCRNKTVQLTGTLKNPLPGTCIFLDELKSNELITVDSAILSNDGNFNFQRVVKQPSFYLLKINENNFCTMLFEPGEKIKLSASYDSLNYPISVTGSAGTELLVEYNRRLRKTIEDLQSLSEIYRRNIDNPDLPEVIDSLNNLAQNYLDEINAYTKKYIDDNISSLASLMALYQQVAPNVYVLDPGEDLRYFIKVDSAMYSQYPDYDPVISLHQQIQELAAKYEYENSTPMVSAEGMEAPEISLPSPEGDTINLSSTRGSVVLLDFWASWCAPCRSENPNLVEAYNLYHEKGFEIFQVSLDKSKEAWIRGIREDNLDKWIHVSDVKYWNSTVVPLYNISSIPYNLLLDSEGRIIGSNLRGNELKATLAELFK